MILTSLLTLRRQAGTVLGMDMTLLTPMERGWVKYHLALASTREWEIAAFSELFMSEIKAVEDKPKVEVKQSSRPWRVRTYDEVAEILDYDENYPFSQSEFDKAELLKYCVQAEVYDYHLWLKGFKKAGGKPTNVYNYNFGHDWYLLKEAPPVIPKLCGAFSVNLIVPAWLSLKNTSIKAGNTHNNIYFMKDFSVKGYSVPVYKDVR